MPCEKAVEMRIVLDTNIFISALGWKGGNEYNIVKKCFKKELILICSPEILEEFKIVSLRPKFRFSPEEIDEFISALIEASEIVEPEEQLKIIVSDPADNKFLDAAVAGKAKYIISGDKHLLDLKEFKGIKIIRPADFLALQKPL